MGNAARKTDGEDAYRAFFHFWNMAGEMALSDRQSIAETALSVWGRAICCIGTQDVPPEYLDRFLFVRSTLMRYRFSARWSSDAAENMPPDVVDSIRRALLEGDAPQAIPG